MPFFHSFDATNRLDTVRGDALSCAVRHLGAEVIALTRHHPALGDIGLLWRNGRLDPPARGWKNHATVLFPAVGGIKDNRSCTTDGTPIRFRRLYGFARELPFQRIAAEDRGDHFLLHYHLEDTADTRDLYPWRFALDLFYRLFDDRLEQTATVTNRDDRPMPYQVGWHPGFNTPLLGGEKAACHLVLPEGKAIRKGNNAECRLTGDDREVHLSGEFPLDDAQLDATCMFDFSHTPPGLRVVHLADPDRRVGVRVHFPDYPHLGLWSDDGAPFVCIEPWQGMDDSEPQEPFDRKFGVVLLEPGGRQSRRAWIEVVG